MNKQITILVTGAAGFIGYHLCEKLLELGHKVIGLDNINDYYAVQLKLDRLKQLGIDEVTEGKWLKAVLIKIVFNLSNLILKTEVNFQSYLKITR